MGIFIRRMFALWGAEAFGLILSAQLIADFVIENWRVAILLASVVGFANILIRSALLRLSIGINLIIFIALAFFLNGFIIILAAKIIEGATIRDLPTATATVFMTACISFLFARLFRVDDDFIDYRHILQSIRRRKSDTPGFIFLEIDGLSEPVLRQAIHKGYMPTLKNWLRRGSHKVVSWECACPSQTWASQAGILHGNNFGIPASRWYDKERDELMLMNRPQHASELEKRLSNGEGLLAGNGTSLSNIFSGDAINSMLTFSTVRDPSRKGSRDYYAYFMIPYRLIRMATLMLWEIVAELWQAYRQHRRNAQPRVNRWGMYPFKRALNTVLLHEATVYALCSNLSAGAPAIYATLTDYDIVAHYAGITRPEAMKMLQKIDRRLEQLERLSQKAPRPYHFVILADHGQSQGATFSQRYGITLEQLAQDLLATDHRNGASSLSMANGNGRNIARHEEIARVYAAHNGNGNHRRNGALNGKSKDAQLHTTPRKEKGVIVLASGNLGLIYFTGRKERLSWEQINEAFPCIIPGLAGHEGIGFILTHSTEHGAIAIGAKGTHYLDENRVEGEDPLAVFGANAAAHLRRINRFPNVADIMVNSFYDPIKDEVAAFEEQVGSHGGLGGKQCQSFLLYPATFTIESESIIGAESVHQILRAWLDATQRKPRNPTSQNAMKLKTPGTMA